MISFFYDLNPAIQAFIAGIFTFLITSFGAASVFLFKKFNKNLLNTFLSISAGVMIAASFFSLIIPAIEMSENLNLTPIIVLLIGILSGTLLLFIGDKILSNKINITKNKKRTAMLFTSIMLHNIPEYCIYYVSRKRNIISVKIYEKKSLLDFLFSSKFIS